MRMKAGLRQVDVAERLECSLQTVKDYENGKYTPGLDAIGMLTTIYEVPVGDLINALKEVRNGNGNGR